MRNIVWLYLYEVLRIGKLIQIESRIAVTKGWEGLSNVYKFLLENKTILETDGGDGCKILSM